MLSCSVWEIPPPQKKTPPQPMLKKKVHLLLKIDNLKHLSKKKVRSVQKAFVQTVYIQLYSSTPLAFLRYCERPVAQINSEKKKDIQLKVVFML